MSDLKKVFHNKVILIVDDEPHIRELLALRFEAFGAKCLLAKSGNQAYTIISKEPIDLLISDVKMPDGTGIELLEKLQGEGHQFPIFMISGYSDLSPQKAKELGALEIINKPFAPDLAVRLVARGFK